MAAKLKILGHPLRLKLLIHMAQEHSCVSDLWQCVGEKQPVVSQHLALLKEHGVVESHPAGNRRLYSIRDPDVRRILDLLSASMPSLEETDR